MGRGIIIVAVILDVQAVTENSKTTYKRGVSRQLVLKMYIKKKKIELG